MTTTDEQRRYLIAIDFQIDQLQQRIAALIVRIEDMKSIDATVHSQLELLATMRVTVKSLTVARAKALVPLETGEECAHPRFKQRQE